MRDNELPKRTGSRRPLVVQMTTVPTSLNYYAGRARFLTESGYDVAGVSSPGSELDEFGRREGVATHAVTMSRRISPLADTQSLAKLVRLFHRIRPSIVHAHTPKADLLGALAATVTGVPVTIVSLFGLPQMTQTGWRRRILDATTKLACRHADLVWCDSQSMRDYVVAQQLADDQKSIVLAQGSANGVDTSGQFNPTRYRRADRSVLKQSLGIPPGDTVLGFVGRVVGDKGVRELAESWKWIRARHPNTRLLIVGPWEEKDSVSPQIEAALRADNRVHIAGPTDEVPAYLAIMDVFVFPSYREGCPTAVLEAAAMKLPVIATDIPGCRETLVHEKTGLAVAVRDATSLQKAIARYLESPQLRERHGAAGRRMVQKRYQPIDVWRALNERYEQLLGLTGESAVARRAA